MRAALNNRTTSIRLPEKLRFRLEEASGRLHRGMNWIVIRAIEQYLENAKIDALQEEAKKQSLLAAQMDRDWEIWSDNADIRGWE